MSDSHLTIDVPIDIGPEVYQIFSGRFRRRIVGLLGVGRIGVVRCGFRDQSGKSGLDRSAKTLVTPLLSRTAMKIKKIVIGGVLLVICLPVAFTLAAFACFPSWIRPTEPLSRV